MDYLRFFVAALLLSTTLFPTNIDASNAVTSRINSPDFSDNDEIPADTIQLDELIVTGSMPRVNPRDIPASISVVRGQQIEERLQPSLLPLLTEEVPGLFISQRGVMGYGVQPVRQGE